MLILPRLQYADTVNVVVGSGGQKQSFTVHASRITVRSKFFAAAVSDKWTTSDARKGTVDLSEESPLLFDLYLHYVYNDKVVLGDASQHVLRERPDCANYREYRETHRLFINLYMLADKLGDCKSATLIMDTFDDTIYEQIGLPNSRHMHVAFDGSPESSPLRTLLVDLLAYDSTPATFNTADYELMPKAAVQGALMRVMETMEESGKKTVEDAFDPDFIQRDKERYHEYDDLHPPPQRSKEDGRSVVVPGELGASA